MSSQIAAEAYPLSGGYSGPQLAPAWVLRPVMGIERLMPQAILRLAALRMTIVIQKVTQEPAPQGR